MSCTGAGADLFEDQDISTVLLQPDRVGFNIAQDPVKIVLVDPEKLTAVFSCNNSGSPVGK